MDEYKNEIKSIIQNVEKVCKDMQSVLDTTKKTILEMKIKERNRDKKLNSMKEELEELKKLFFDEKSKITVVDKIKKHPDAFIGITKEINSKETDREKELQKKIVCMEKELKELKEVFYEYFNKMIEDGIASDKKEQVKTLLTLLNDKRNKV